MEILKRIVAVVITICIMNGLCFAYYNPTHNSTKNAYRLEPMGVGFQATEGFAITRTDDKGFVNRVLPLEESEYIIVMGSSQGAGINVPIEKRFSDQLNTMLGYDNTLKVYNVSYSGGDFADIVHNFKQLMEEFPKAQDIIIELDSAHLNLSLADLEYAMKQVDNQNSITGERLSDYSKREECFSFLKESLPLGLLLVKQFYAWKPLMTNISIKTNEYVTIQKSQEDYEDLAYWDQCFELITGQTDARIIIVFHDPVNMVASATTDTTMPDKMQKIEKICNKYNVEVINMLPVFTENYIENYELPYGFHNTKMNEGHLNQVGHRLIAEELYSYLSEKRINE